LLVIKIACVHLLFGLLGERSISCLFAFKNKPLPLRVAKSGA